MKIIFAGTPPFAASILEGLLNANLNVIACFSQPDKPRGRGKKLQETPTKIVAQKFNIPVFQPDNFKSQENIDLLASLKPELMLVVAYGLLLPQKVLDIPKFGCINIHGSILPKYRGAAPIQHSILNGDKETGITLFQIEKGMDSGDILGIYKCPILDSDTTKTMLEKFVPISINATLDIVNKLNTNTITKTKQDSNQATFAPKINKTDALINWEKEEALTIDRKIRAYNPWPTAFFNIQNIPIKIIKAELLNDFNNIKNEKLTPGKIIEINKNELIITTKKGSISIKKIQFPSSKILDIKDVINSQKYINILKPLIL